MREWIKKHMPEGLIHLYQKARYLWIVWLFYFFRLFKIQPGRVVFCNVWGYGDNGKYIAEELLKRIREASADVELIFVTNHPAAAHAPNGIKVLRTNSPEAVFALATARVWVDSNRKEAYIRKRKGQYYIQTWHGGIPLKKIEGDCAGFLGDTYIRRAKWDSSMTDLYLSNGGFCTEMYRRAFWYQGEILECGTPRLDRLLRKQNTSGTRIREKYGIAKTQKIAIYAPTYRNREGMEAYLLKLDETVTALSERFGNEFVLFVRFHPLTAGLTENIRWGKNIKNANEARDFYELLEAADVLITDYSNTMFEAAFAGKPVFLFMKDLDEYSRQRGLYFQISELPFPCSFCEEELLQTIRTFDEKLYIEKTGKFIEKLQVKETGCAAKLAADRIIEKLAIF